MGSAVQLLGGRRTTAAELRTMLSAPNAANPARHSGQAGFAIVRLQPLSGSGQQDGDDTADDGQQQADGDVVAVATPPVPIVGQSVPPFRVYAV